VRRRWARPCGAGATADRGFSTRTRDRSSPVDTTRRKAATILGTILVLLVAVFYVPIMFAQPTVETLNTWPIPSCSPPASSSAPALSPHAPPFPATPRATTHRHISIDRILAGFCITRPGKFPTIKPNRHGDHPEPGDDPRSRTGHPPG
jgi:hypothetical protein